LSKLVPISHEEAIDLNYPRCCLGSSLGLGTRGIYADFYLVDERRRRRHRRKAAAQRREDARWWAEIFSKRLGRSVSYAHARTRKVIYSTPLSVMPGISGARPGVIVLDDPLLGDRHG
jgi:hypothetical protein